MARQTPIDLSIVKAWLAAWNESDVFSDDAVRNLLFLITDPWCLVVVTLGVGRDPRCLVFGHRKLMIPARISPPPTTLKPTVGFAKFEFAKKERVDSSTFVGPVAPSRRLSVNLAPDRREVRESSVKNSEAID
jgi:hypothetical protein